MIRLFELFSGFGGASWGLKMANIPFECVGYSEIDKNAIKIYDTNFPGIKNYGDITKIDPKDLPDFNLLTGGFPCGLRGQKIKTTNGYKNIEDITNLDFVLSHNNKYQRVIKVMKRISNHFNTIKAVGCYNLNITDEHPILTFDGWKQVKDLKVGDYVSYNINQKRENILNLTKTELWLLGRYCADGYIEKKRERLYFCIGKKKQPQFEAYIKEYDYSVGHKDRSCLDYQIKDEKLLHLCKMFKSGAKNKEIPNFIIDLPIYLLINFLDGYISGDGHIRYRKGTKQIMFSTVSENLILGLQEIFIKVYQRVPTISIRKDKRSINFNDSYNGQLDIGKNKDSFILGEKIYSKIKSIERNEVDVEVFNFEVYEDNTYTINNVIVHNCQDVSHAGKRDLNKGRTNLYKEILRIASIKKPRYMVLENVRGLLSMGKKDYLSETYFDKIRNNIRSLGYDIRYKVLNSRDYGVPQNRERIWIICKLGTFEFGEFQFPEPFPLKIFVKDILDKEVDSKYNLSEKQIKMIEERLRHKKDMVIEKDVSQTLCSRDYKDDGKRVNLKKIQFDMSGKGYKSQQDRVYDTDGVMCCLPNANPTNKVNIYSLQPRSPDRPSLKNGTSSGGSGQLVKSDGTTYCLDTGNSQANGLAMNCLTEAIGRRESSQEFTKSCEIINRTNAEFRRLTPRECFRLMGFLKDEIDISGISDTGLYKLMGNGWDVHLVSLIFKNLFKEHT